MRPDLAALSLPRVSSAQEGATALMEAAAGGHTESVVALLADPRVEVNAKDNVRPRLACARAAARVRWRRGRRRAVPMALPGHPFPLTLPLKIAEAAVHWSKIAEGIGRPRAHAA